MKTNPPMARINFIIGLVALISTGLLSGYVLTSPRAKLVYVDSEKLVNGYKGMQEARAEYQKKSATWKANIDTLTDEIQQAIAKYEKESPGMSPRERKVTEELIRSRQKQLVDYQAALRSQASQEDEQMSKAVLSEINGYLKRYGQEHGYTIILAATNYGNIAYADDELDITEEVLQGLNQAYSPK